MGASDFDIVKANAFTPKDATKRIPMGAQQAHLADAGTTAVAPAALTYAAPAVIPAAAGEPTASSLVETQGLRTQVIALAADVTALRLVIAALVTDNTAKTAKINSLIDTIEAFGMNAAA